MMKLISAQVRKQFDTFNSSIGLPRLLSGSLVLFQRPCQAFFRPSYCVITTPLPPKCFASGFSVFLPLGHWADHEIKNSSPKQDRFNKCDLFFSVSQNLFRKCQIRLNVLLRGCVVKLRTSLLSPVFAVLPMSTPCFHMWCIVEYIVVQALKGPWRKLISSFKKH